MVGCFSKEPVQRGGDWHLFLHQSHHHDDDALYSAGLTPFVFALFSPQQNMVRSKLDQQKGTKPSMYLLDSG